MGRAISYIHSVNPAARIGVSGILPRPKNWDKFDEKMLKARVYTNVAMSIFCKAAGVEYIKTESCLTDQDPDIPIYRADGLHLTDEGSVYVKTYMGGKIGELLGPAKRCTKRKIKA
jgi:hypothetical protein